MAPTKAFSTNTEIRIKSTKKNKMITTRKNNNTKKERQNLLGNWTQKPFSQITQWKAYICFVSNCTSISINMTPITLGSIEIEMPNVIYICVLCYVCCSVSLTIALFANHCYGMVYSAITSWDEGQWWKKRRRR